MGEETRSSEATALETTGPERVKEAVIIAARRLFAERGIHAVSVREIAREVGVSHTLLHLYFGSKEDIVRQVLSSYDERFAAHIAESPDIATAVGDVFRAVAADRELVRVLAAALVEGIVPHRIEAEADAQRALVDRLHDRSDVELDPRVLSCLIASTAIGWAVAADWLRESVGLEGMDEDGLRNAMSDTLEHMVRECI